jgi:hypothetical protein
MKMKHLAGLAAAALVLPTSGSTQKNYGPEETRACVVDTLTDMGFARHFNSIDGTASGVTILFGRNYMDVTREDGSVGNHRVSSVLAFQPNADFSLTLAIEPPLFQPDPAIGYSFILKQAENGFDYQATVDMGGELSRSGDEFVILDTLGGEITDEIAGRLLMDCYGKKQAATELKL